MSTESKPRPPDLRDPRLQAAIRREAARLSLHPDNAVIDEWVEAVYKSFDREPQEEG
jgi:Protein  of unknown function (DUF3018)